jgi:hypothetical protein
MRETVTSGESTRMPPGHKHPVRRVVAAGFALAMSLLAACGGNSTEEDTLFVKQHLYLNGPDGVKFEISVVKDASGKDVVTATRVGN